VWSAPAERWIAQRSRRSCSPIPHARQQLEAITHPLVRAAFEREREAAGADAIVVNDIPLLRSLAMAAGFHLVVTAEAPAPTRLDRLVGRGLAEADAMARIRSQISDEERRRFSDVWLVNDGDHDQLRTAVTQLWSGRLAPFAENLAAGRRARRGPAVLHAWDPEWARLAALLAARISAATGGLPVEHIGSTAIPGLAAKDVIDLQLVVPDLATADRLAGGLAAAGFPRLDGTYLDNIHPIPGIPESSDPAGWDKRLHGNADPGRDVNLHLRVRDAPNQRHALLFRDWLRADRAAREEYQSLKRELAGRFAGDRDSGRYAEAKEPWFTVASSRAEDWAAATGWRRLD
jgi:dephospho-CoA kinase